MVVIARIGSMKFLPIMNVGMRRPAARGVRRLIRNRAGKSPRQQAQGRRINIGPRELRRPGGPAMNRFAHRIIMSVLLIAALVLIWNVLGPR
jgi:hypothetical protein